VHKKAFITGVTGQDGSYLSEFLLDKGYEVHGLIRRSSSFNISRIAHLHQDRHVRENKFHIHYGDLSDGSSLTNLILRIQPDELYNLAAQSHVMSSFTMPVFTGAIDGLAPLSILEAIRTSGLPIKYYQASTSELFGAMPPPQNEETRFYPRSPYAAAKLYAYWTTVNYREAYGIHASNGILFNHESPRRGETFVTRKISQGVAQIKMGLLKKIYLGNLDAIRDWGYAKEYVESMWLMLQQPQPSDYVVATGIGASVRDFCERAFNRVELNWKDHVVFDESYIRPTEVNALIGDPTKAKTHLGWVAKTHWDELADLMVDSDLLNLQR
jgi:GDPmannose 4,6-dehydratase